MSILRLAVIGGGHLGRIHAKLANANEQFEVVGVVDPSEASRKLVEEQLGLPTSSSIEPYLDRIDAAVVAAPTVAHYEVTSQLLREGVHALVEKPLATTADQAHRLVQIAKSHGRVLQTGHVERFNPNWTTASEHLGKAKFIEAERSGPYSGRSTDIGVVMDLMIHDLDLILSLDKTPLTKVSASGLALLGKHEDIAEARLEFASGLVANIRASRLATQANRTMRLFTTSGYADLDFSSDVVKLVKPSLSILAREVALDEMPHEQRMQAKDSVMSELFEQHSLEVPGRNAILDEQNDFAISIQTGSSPAVSGEDGARAVEVAGQIVDAVAAHRWEGELSKSWHVGAQAALEPRILPYPSTTSVEPGESRKAG